MQIVLSVSALLFFTIRPPKLQQNCKLIAQTDDIALTIWAQSWLETFTISGLNNFALRIVLLVCYVVTAGLHQC
jgi:hypothetical protein